MVVWLEGYWFSRIACKFAWSGGEMVSVKPLIAWKLALCIYRFWEGIHAVLLYNSARKKNLIITCIVARVLWKGIVGVYVLEYRPTLNCWVKFPVRKCVAFCWVQKLIWFNVIKMIIFDWIYNSLYICMKKNKNILYTLRFLFSILLRQTSNNKNDCISYKTADDCFS